MAEAIAVTVAKAVTDHLGRATFGQAVTIERSYADWELALDEAATTRIDVVLVTTEQTTELTTRGGSQYLVPIDIAVRKRFEVDGDRIPNDQVDALMLLVQNVHDHFTPERPNDFPIASWEETKILVAPLTKHLRELRQFTGIVRVTFRVYKDR